MTVEKKIKEEVQRAEDLYGAFTSTHEALGVLMEEVSELVDAIRSNNLRDVQREAIQVSAVAMRLAAEIVVSYGTDSHFWHRSTGKPNSISYRLGTDWHEVDKGDR